MAESQRLPLFPEPLTSEQLGILEQLAHQADSMSFSSLAQQCDEYRESVREAARKSGFVHAALASGLADSMTRVLRVLDEEPSPRTRLAERWMKAAVLYFVRTTDSDHDLHSPTGFDDDAEVWNACLALAGLKEFAVSPEDFDDA